MQVVFHIGAHCTGQDRLVRSLLKNRDALAQLGVAVPGPGRYRRVLSEVLQKLRGSQASAETQDLLLEAVLDSDDASRVILSNESFISMPSAVMHQGELYGKIGKSAWLRAAFPSVEAEFAMSLRNLATFLPALYDRLGTEVSGPEEFLEGSDPRWHAWSDVILSLRDANPDSRITVWCDEDSPFLWPEIMRELADVDALLPLDGENDRVIALLSRDGNARLSAALEATPPEDEYDRRRLLSEFLEEYAEDAAVEQEISLPGWTQDLIDELTEAYDEDVERIGNIPGVRLLTP